MALEGHMHRGIVRLEGEKTGSRTLHPIGGSFTTYSPSIHSLSRY